MDPTKFTVYLLTNTKTGKKYVGITSNFAKRMREHKCAGNDCLISRAIRKHGWAAFIAEPLDSTSSKEEIFELEKQYILKYDCTNPHIGYNLTRGGEGNWGYAVSPETRQKQRNAKLGKPLSASHREKISRAHIGRKMPIETREKISSTQRGKSVPTRGHRWTDEEKLEASERRCGIRYTPEQKLNMSRIKREYYKINCGPNLGKQFSEDWRMNLGKSHAKSYTLRDPTGELVTITNMTKFCRDNGIAAPWAMMAVAAGKKCQYLGWKAA